MLSLSNTAALNPAAARALQSRRETSRTVRCGSRSGAEEEVFFLWRLRKLELRVLVVLFDFETGFLLSIRAHYMLLLTRRILPKSAMPEGLKLCPRRATSERLRF